MKEIKLNLHGVNAAIQGHIVSEERMRELGFTDYAKDRWYFSKKIQFPKNKNWKYIDITFNVTIPKDGSDIAIDVLDENFLQPYDYQHILNDNPNHPCAKIVSEQVEKWMEYLQDNGVLSGHIRGQYI